MTSVVPNSEADKHNIMVGWTLTKINNKNFKVYTQESLNDCVDGKQEYVLTFFKSVVTILKVVFRSIQTVDKSSHVYIRCV